jgi:hypothetical protein
MLGDVEEVGGLEMLVALLVVGVDRGGVDLRVDLPGAGLPGVYSITPENPVKRPDTLPTRCLMRKPTWEWDASIS